MKDDERSYLSFMSAQVSGRLRERIVAEVSRARIITDREEDVLARREHEPPAAVSLPAPAKAEPSQPAADERKGDQTADTKGKAPPHVEHEPAQLLAARPDEVTRGAAREIVRECRELSREFGYYTPAVPDLSAEQMQEARDHDATRAGTESPDYVLDFTGEFCWRQEMSSVGNR